jgi:hypothetical protein
MANIAKSDQIINLSNPKAVLPSYLAKAPKIVGNIPIGNPRNRISLKGREFHIIRSGVEVGVLETKHADVVIVGAVPHISRLYYSTRYSDAEQKAPACYSPDGIKPANDVQNPQSSICATCQQNKIGSAQGGDDMESKGRACGFFRRIAVILSNDPEHVVYQLDLKSQTLFDKQGDPANNRYGFNEYIRKLASANNGAGIDPGYVVTRITFDPKVSVPKLLFQPIGFIEKELADVVIQLVGSDVVKNTLDISMTTIDFTSEVRDTGSPSEPVRSVKVTDDEVAKLIANLEP